MVFVAAPERCETRIHLTLLCWVERLSLSIFSFVHSLA